MHSSETLDTPKPDATPHVANTHPRSSSYAPATRLPRNQPTRKRHCTPSSLIVYYQNSGGMRTKTNTLNLALSHSDYHLVVFSESWLKEGILDSELSSNYQFFRRDRSSATSNLSRGGGTLIGVKKL